MNRRLALLLAVTAILLASIQYFLPGRQFRPSSSSAADLLRPGAARIADPEPLTLFPKKAAGPQRMVQVPALDTFLVAGIDGKWCAIRYRGTNGFADCDEARMNSIPLDSPGWRIWLRHNYKADRWQFWVLNVSLIALLVLLRPGFRHFERRILRNGAGGAPGRSGSRVGRFLSSLLQPNFDHLYFLCILAPAGCIGVAMFDNDALLSLFQFKFDYVLHGRGAAASILSGMCLAVVVGVGLEIAGGFLAYGFKPGILRGIGVLVAGALTTATTIAAIMPAILLLCGFLALMVFGSMGGASAPSRNPGGRADDSYEGVCPACGGTGKTGTSGSVFGGCGRCGSTGRVRHKR
ncbi:MAG TPA: hypothetical protein PKO15_17660 [Fibrobacteria bacterium]|nr:hypothetical protein [Fibrobacteria bacterium]